MFASYNPARKPSSPVKGNRKIFANAMVAHVWAQQTQPEGRSNNGNFYFSGRTIYSYGSHFPIAQFSECGRVIWFTGASYSVSTSGHISYVRAAIDGLRVPVVIVPDLRDFHPRHIRAETREAIEHKIMWRTENYPDQAANEWKLFQTIAGTPRKRLPLKPIAYLEAIQAKADAKAKIVKLADARRVADQANSMQWATIAPVVDFRTVDDGAYPTRYYLSQDNARNAERLRSQFAKARFALATQTGAKSKTDMKRMRDAYNATLIATRIRNVWHATVAAIDMARNEAQERQIILNALGNIETGAACEYWYESGVGPDKCVETEILSSRIRRAFKLGFTAAEVAPLMHILQTRLFYRESDNRTPESIDLVHMRRMAELDAKAGRKRVTPDAWQSGIGAANQYGYSETLVRRKGDTLETSRGASCPFAHAVVAFVKAQDCRRTGNAWKRNGQTIRVGHFQVDSIDAEGNMIAGCHTLEWQEMLRLALKEVPHLVKPRFGLPAVLGL